MLSFLFPHLRFNRFAYQAQKVVDFVFKHQPIKQWSFHQKIIRYLDYQSDMAEKLVDFSLKTSTVFGWLSSWIPSTHAYASRQSIAGSLSAARDLYHQINIEYYRHVNNEMKKQLYTPSIKSMLQASKTNQPRTQSLVVNDHHHDTQPEKRRHSVR